MTSITMDVFNPGALNGFIYRHGLLPEIRSNVYLGRLVPEAFYSTLFGGT